LSATSWREQVNLGWDDDEVRFVLDQHSELDFYNASSLKQQSEGRHVAPLKPIILIPSQPVFALSPWWYVLSGEAKHTNFIVIGLTRRHTSFEASTLTSMRLFLLFWYLILEIFRPCGIFIFHLIKHLIFLHTYVLVGLWYLSLLNEGNEEHKNWHEPVVKLPGCHIEIRGQKRNLMVST